jgi:hypothetical protein
VEAAAGDDETRTEWAQPGVELRDVARAADCADLGRGADAAAESRDLVGQRRSDAGEVEDAGGGKVEGADAGNGGLQLPEPVGVDERRPPDAVGQRPRVKLGETPELALVRSHDDLPAALVRDAVLVAEAIHCSITLHTETCLQRPRDVIHARMNDAAVVACLVQAGRRLLLEHDDIETGAAAQRFPSHREADDSGADNDQVCTGCCAPRSHASFWTTTAGAVDL